MKCFPFFHSLCLLTCHGVYYLPVNAVLTGAQDACCECEPLAQGPTRAVHAQSTGSSVTPADRAGKQSPLRTSNPWGITTSGRCTGYLDWKWVRGSLPFMGGTCLVAASPGQGQPSQVPAGDRGWQQLLGRCVYVTLMGSQAPASKGMGSQEAGGQREVRRHTHEPGTTPQRRLHYPTGLHLQHMSSKTKSLRT